MGTQVYDEVGRMESTQGYILSVHCGPERQVPGNRPFTETLE